MDSEAEALFREDVNRLGCYMDRPGRAYELAGHRIKVISRFDIVGMVSGAEHPLQYEHFTTPFGAAYWILTKKREQDRIWQEALGG